MGKKAVRCLRLAAWILVIGHGVTTRADWITHLYGPHAEAALLDTADVPESSGLIASRISPDIYWTHNDSGGTSDVWALRLNAADITAHVARKMGVAHLNAVSNVDWEDIAAGPGPRIYVFDGGDNPPCDRTDKRIHRFVEPVIDPNGPLVSVTPAVESIRFEYPDSANPLLPADANDERFDCEAIFVHPANGDVYLVTKRTNANVGTARVYKLTAASLIWNSAAVHVLQWVADIGSHVSGTATGADIDVYGRRVLVRNYSTAYEFTLPAGQPFDVLFSGIPRSISLAGEIQGEGICYAASGGDILCTSEVLFIGPQTCPLYRIPWQLANARAGQLRSDRATVLWDTASPANSTVHYGMSTTYGGMAGDPVVVTAHAVLLTSLLPATRYYYRVTSGSLVYPGAAEATEVHLTTPAGPPGDFDLDQDVDQEDFGRFQACLSGPAAPQTDPACSAARLDGDQDVDSADLAIFQSCISGPSYPANPGCAD